MNDVLGHVEEGLFPPKQLDQRRAWVFTSGEMLRISTLDEEHVLFALTYCLANAGKVRRHYYIELRAVPDDEDESARRWMLKKPAVRALMKRLVVLEEEKQEQRREARELEKFLTLGAQAEIDRVVFG